MEGHLFWRRLINYAESQGIADVVLLAKLEYLNPAGSVKDRVALSMIEDAEKSGILKRERPLSNRLPAIRVSVWPQWYAAKGYKAVFTLPETMSIERRKLLRAYGAKLVLTDGSKGMKGAIEKAEELKQNIEGSVILGQFTNAPILLSTGRRPDRRFGKIRTERSISLWQVSVQAAQSPVWANTSGSETPGLKW